MVADPVRFIAISRNQHPRRFPQMRAFADPKFTAALLRNRPTQGAAFMLNSRTHRGEVIDANQPGNSFDLPNANISKLHTL